MFNLIVSGRVEDDRRGLISVGRVFQYTEDEILEKLTKDGKIDFHSVMKFPTLLIEEGQDDQTPRIAKLIRVTPIGKDYQLDYTIDPRFPKLTNSKIATLLIDLHMIDWELQTNHWAIKDIDLFEVLFRNSAMKPHTPAIFQLSPKPVNRKLISFMMPFSSQFTPVYLGIKAALESQGFHCKRADDMWVHDHVMKDIIELICTSAVIVCDLSTKNPNVFYEAGIAHTLGKEVVLITQSHDDVPFDLRPIRYLPYLNNDQGIAKIAAEVLSRVRDVT